MLFEEVSFVGVYFALPLLYSLLKTTINISLYCCLNSCCLRSYNTTSRAKILYLLFLW